MPERAKLDRLGKEARVVKFPDGSKGVILVEAGTPQDEADEIAARLWAESPEAGVPRDLGGSLLDGI
ncbi:MULTISPECIES: hypothetical protein [Streptomyces]|uniref:hypothetical protein n=1 Tax=Streptomyces TaxID=1883 RepID=UPI003CF11BAD